MKKILLLMLLCTALACKKDKTPTKENEKPAEVETEEVKYKKFVFDDEIYEVEKIGIGYWTTKNFNSTKFGGKKPVYTFPSGFSPGRTYLPSEIHEIDPPNGYRLPNANDFFFLMIEARGRSSTWEDAIDSFGVPGEKYEVNDIEAVKSLGSINKWELTKTDNQIKFSAEPNDKSVDYHNDKAYESIKILGQQNGWKVYLEIRVNMDGTGRVGVYIFDKFHKDDQTRYAVRFVKDVTPKEE